MARTAPDPQGGPSGGVDPFPALPPADNGLIELSARKFRLVLIDPAALTRESLAHLLQERADDFHIETFSDYGRAANGAAQHPAAILVNGKSLDISDPTLAEVVAGVGGLWPGAPCMLISEQANEPMAGLRAIKNGWRGFFPATLEVDLLTAAIRLVMANGIFLPPCVLQELCANHQAPGVT